jgi:hypothetical protein
MIPILIDYYEVATGRHVQETVEVQADPDREDWPDLFFYTDDNGGCDCERGATFDRLTRQAEREHACGESAYFVLITDCAGETEYWREDDWMEG